MSYLLRSERLFYEPFSREHLDFLHRLWTDPDVRRYLWDDLVISRERAAEGIDASIASFGEHDFGYLLLRLADDSREVGFAGLFHIDGTDDIEIYFGIMPDFWRQGLAAEAGREVLRWAFVDLGLERVYGRTDVPNERSHRTLERLGMRFEEETLYKGLPTSCYVLEAGQYLSGLRSC